MPDDEVFTGGKFSKKKAGIKRRKQNSKDRASKDYVEKHSPFDATDRVDSFWILLFHQVRYYMDTKFQYPIDAMSRAKLLRYIKMNGELKIIDFLGNEYGHTNKREARFGWMLQKLLWCMLL